MNKVLCDFFSRRLLEKAIHPMPFQKMFSRREFVDLVEEYQTLSNRQWYRKRQVEKMIALRARDVLDDVKSCIKPEAIKFKRYNGTTVKATAFGRKG